MNGAGTGTAVFISTPRSVEGRDDSETKGGEDHRRRHGVHRRRVRAGSGLARPRSSAWSKEPRSSRAQPSLRTIAPAPVHARNLRDPAEPPLRILQCHLRGGSIQEGRRVLGRRVRSDRVSHGGGHGARLAGAPFRGNCSLRTACARAACSSPADYRWHLRYQWQARFFPRLVARVPELRREPLTFGSSWGRPPSGSPPRWPGSRRPGVVRLPSPSPCHRCSTFAEPLRTPNPIERRRPA